jgi:hypothetical protein
LSFHAAAGRLVCTADWSTGMSIDLTDRKGAALTAALPAPTR